MKWLGALSMVVFSAVASGCSGGDRSSRTESDAEALLATVPVALAAPTGTVSPTTARALLVKWQSLQRVHPVFDAVLSLGTETAQACLDGQPNAGTYDLLCLTMGQATGRLTFHALAADGDAGLEGRVDVALEDACVGDACVNAQLSVEIIDLPGCAPLATLAAVATFSGGGAPAESFAFGAEGGMGRGTLLPHVVYFDAHDGSFVIDGDGGADTGGAFLVSGGDRSFECQFLGSGGQCSGATSFVF